MKAVVDAVRVKKFKSTSGYETKLSKLMNKVRKAKPGKTRFEMREECNTLKFTSLGKKAAPVNQIDICKIKDLKTTSKSEKVVGFTYPGPDGKKPLLLVAMRFEKESDYVCFVSMVKNCSYYCCENQIRASDNASSCGSNYSGYSDNNDRCMSHCNHYTGGNGNCRYHCGHHYYGQGNFQYCAHGPLRIQAPHDYGIGEVDCLSSASSASSSDCSDNSSVDYYYDEGGECCENYGINCYY